MSRCVMVGGPIDGEVIEREWPTCDLVVSELLESGRLRHTAYRASLRDGDGVWMMTVAEVMYR